MKSSSMLFFEKGAFEAWLLRQPVIISSPLPMNFCTWQLQMFGKSQRVKTQTVKTSESQKKMFAEDISQKISLKIEDITFTVFLKYFWIPSKSSWKIAFF